MGEIADMMLDGTLCEGCGEYIGSDAGFPQYCSRACAAGRGMAYAPPGRRGRKTAPRRMSSRARQLSREDAPFACSCGRKFYEQVAMDQHRVAKKCPA